MDRASLWRFDHDGGSWSLRRDRCPLSDVHLSQLIAGVYVITAGNDIVYVGETGDHRLQRVITGLRSGYPWRDDPALRATGLECWYFDERLPALEWTNAEARQALEMEVAVAISRTVNGWPRLLNGASPRGAYPRSMAFVTAVPFILEVIARRGTITWP